jgi:exodeoxyribonuclease VII small subunit
MSDSTPNKPDTMTFEDAMGRLEEVVQGMEGDRLPLEEMLTAYEEGSKLLKVCRARIESARQRVELITARMDSEEQATLTPFDPSETESAITDAASRPAARTTSARRSTTSGKPTTNDDEDIRLF